MRRNSGGQAHSEHQHQQTNRETAQTAKLREVRTLRAWNFIPGDVFFRPPAWARSTQDHKRVVHRSWWEEELAGSHLSYKEWATFFLTGTSSRDWGINKWLIGFRCCDSQICLGVKHDWRRKSFDWRWRKHKETSRQIEDSRSHRSSSGISGLQDQQVVLISMTCFRLDKQDSLSELFGCWACFRRKVLVYHAMTPLDRGLSLRALIELINLRLYCSP